MRLSDEARMPVRPVDFWVSVAVVSAALCGIGVCEIQSGHVPEIGNWFLGSSLVLVWVLVLYQLIRYGRRAFPWQRAVFLAGFTFFAGGNLWRHPPMAVTWLSWLGCLVVIVGALLPFLEFRKSREGA